MGVHAAIAIRHAATAFFLKHPKQGLGGATTRPQPRRRGARAPCEEAPVHTAARRGWSLDGAEQRPAPLTRYSRPQTTSTVVCPPDDDHYGRPRLRPCVSLSACLSRLRVSLPRPARPRPSPEQYPASSSPLGPPLVLAAPLPRAALARRADHQRCGEAAWDRQVRDQIAWDPRDRIAAPAARACRPRVRQAELTAAILLPGEPLSRSSRLRG